MKGIPGVTIAAVTAAVLVMGGTASASTTCNLVASPTGSDSASGSASAPFQTAQKLVDSLAPGQTGCLRAGTYDENLTLRTSDITLTSYPGETATVVGRLWVSQTANQATVSGLNLDGVNSQNLPSPSVNANDVTFSNDNVTDDHTAICFDIGSPTWGTATNTVITDNRIHDCGVLPAQNHDHGIYLEAAYGTQISWNLIYHNADRGIQFYPHAQNTTVDHNVIDGNGENIDFSGAYGIASDNNQVYDNMVTNAAIRYDVESWYPSGNPIGQNNTVTNNCIWGGAMGTIDTSGGGFTASGNTFADPQYVDPAAGDYYLASGSPCLSIAGNVAAVVDGTETVAQATSSTSGSSTPPAPKTNRGHHVTAQVALEIVARHGKAIHSKDHRARRHRSQRTRHTQRTRHSQRKRHAHAGRRTKR